MEQQKNGCPQSNLAATHPWLYHYTNAHAFRSIVTGNSLWSTYYENLNDATEFQHMRKPLVQVSADHFQPVIEALADATPAIKEVIDKDGGLRRAAVRVAETMSNTLYKVTFEQAEKERMQNSFVTSFCAHPDNSYEAENGLLSQWRGYARDGGYCLVFNTERLETLMEEEQSAYLYWYMGLSQVHYFTGAQSLPPSFFELVEKSKDVIDAVLRREDFGVEQLFTPFVTSAVSIKHRGFAEEQEVRLVAMAATRQTDDEMRGTPGYVSLPIKYMFTCERDARKKRHISLFGPERSKLPLVKVIVGPARDPTRGVAVARETVGKGIEIVRSKTPLAW
jgi:hypothetical protein